MGFLKGKPKILLKNSLDFLSHPVTLLYLFVGFPALLAASIFFAKHEPDFSLLSKKSTGVQTVNTNTSNLNNTK